MPNPFVHVELHTTDADKAKKFCSQLGAAFTQALYS